MSFEKFFQIIDRTAIGDFVARKQALVESTDPKHIYVENVRSFFGLNYTMARALCELAVRRGLFEKRVGLLCPKHKRIICERTEGQPQESIVVCEICEGMGEDTYSFAAENLRAIEFYRLND